MMNELLKLDNFPIKSMNEEKIALAEKEMMQEPQVECPVIHRFGPGLYVREVHIPADTFAIGHYQKTEHLNIFLKGKVAILKDDGTVEVLTAPMIFTAKPGRKIGYVYEDMVWLNIYATDERDVEKLEKKYLTKSQTWENQAEKIEALKKHKQLESHNDFKKTIESLGFTESQVNEQSFNDDDMTDLPFGNYKFKKGKSSIHGTGIFATSDIDENEIIGPARIKGKRTILGRFTNHSSSPNAKMILGKNYEIEMMALKKLKGCAGGLDGDEILIDYSDAVKTTLLIKGEQCQE